MDGGFSFGLIRIKRCYFSRRAGGGPARPVWPLQGIYSTGCCHGNPIPHLGGIYNELLPQTCLTRHRGRGTETKGFKNHQVVVIKVT